MNIKQADKIVDKIHELARKLEDDEQLKKLDERYSVAASFCECDINTVSL